MNIYRIAYSDIISNFFSQQIWYHLAKQELKQRYRRSVLGPFWITLSTMVLVALIGPIYAYIFKQPLGPFFLYISISFIIWNFISSVINESCQVFIAAEGFIKTVKLPYSMHIMKHITKNIFILLHNFIVVILLYVFYPAPSLLCFILAIVGFCILFITLFFSSLLIALFCSRYRDIPQVIANLIQVSFFLTPVFWKAELLNDKIVYLNYNIFFNLIELIRQPLLGNIPKIHIYFISISFLLFLILISFISFAKYRNRISYWV
jgi:ABC-type polysaccharide/polyol phosphate export permease